MSAPAAEMSKSARKRANQKARAAEAAAAEAAPPAPEPAPKSKAAAKPKAKATPEPPAAEPKASAKAKGKAKAEPKAPEPAPAPKAEAKAKGKAKAEPSAKKAAAKAKAAPEPEEAPKQEAQGPPVVLDDGKGGDWEVSSGLSKQAQRRKEKAAEKQAQAQEMKAAGVIEARSNQHIPGLAPAEVQVAQTKKGGAKAKAGEAAVSQAVTSVAVVTAAAADNKAKEPEKAVVPDNSVTVTVKVPEAKIGRVVGPKGSNIIMIKEKTGVKTIDMAGDMCTIVGEAQATVLAEHAVRQLIEKGYMALAFEDFEEEGVPLHPSLFPDIIGQKGAIIQLIKKEAKVEVDIPAVPKNGPPGKKYKVTLAGSKQAVALGKEILNSIALYGHHEITHPGMIHHEMEIEEWRYRFLIGSKGSEMRHIQNNYKVKVSIPREHSECQNVVIVGEPRDVERAVKYIEKIMFEADQPRGRGATEKATDDWGDDGEVEDWMKPYMYQRK